MSRYISANQLPVGSKLVIAHQSELPDGFAESDPLGLVFLMSYPQEIIDEYHKEKGSGGRRKKQKELESTTVVVSEETLDS